MNPACAACKGACCETLTLPMPTQANIIEWISLRGRVEGKMIRVEVPCRELTGDGACGIHATKPQICRDFAVGSPACISAIRARRGNDAARLIKLARTNQPNQAESSKQ